MPSLHAFADNITLSNGDRFSGKLISYIDGVCIFDTLYSSSVRIPISQIKSLSTNDQYNLNFLNGDKAAGQLKEEEGGQTALYSPTFGKVIIHVGDVVGMTRNFIKSEYTPSETKKPSSAVASENSYGSETEKQSPLDFLTGSTVLLSPGQYEFDMGVNYKQSRTQYNLPSDGYFQKSSYSARQILVSPTLRAGLYKGFEGYLSLPFTYSYIQDVSSNEYVRDTQDWHAADLAVGGQYQLTKESAAVPAISLTLDVSAPTGKKRYNDALRSWKDPLNNGSGHWSIAPGLAFVRTTDPAIIFGGFSYQYFFADNIDGYNVQPGWVLNSYFGVGFALNEKLSLGSRLSYAYSSNMKADHETIYGSDSDPMDLSLNLSYRVSDQWVVSPQVTFGINDDSGPTALSMNIKRSFN